MCLTAEKRTCYTNKQNKGDEGKKYLKESIQRVAGC